MPHGGRELYPAGLVRLSVVPPDHQGGAQGWPLIVHVHRRHIRKLEAFVRLRLKEHVECKQEIHRGHQRSLQRQRGLCCHWQMPTCCASL